VVSALDREAKSGLGSICMWGTLSTINNEETTGLAEMLVAIDVLNRPWLQTNYLENRVLLDDGFYGSSGAKWGCLSGFVRSTFGFSDRAGSRPA
jgi:hypothetical protein